MQNKQIDCFEAFVTVGRSLRLEQPSRDRSRCELLVKKLVKMSVLLIFKKHLLSTPLLPLFFVFEPK